jgi:tyrosyl-tRNA synthetase
MQGWDSVMVRADVELGGTDQLFNLLVGRQLQEQEGQAPQIVLTTPLLPGIGGGPKMSKSLGNYVGIAEPGTEQFGKLMSIPDDLIPMYLQYATGWPQARIDEVVAQLRSGALHPNAAKRLLARTVVDLYHGAGAGEQAEAHFDRIHKDHALPDDIEVTFELEEPMAVSKLLVATQLAPSLREAKRQIAHKGVRLDNDVVEEDRTIDPAGLPAGGVVLSHGRRNHVRVVPA